MIRRVRAMLAVTVVLMGSLSAYAASTSTFKCNSNPPFTLMLISFSFGPDKSAISTGNGQSHPKVNSMTIQYPMDRNNPVMQRLLTSNEIVKTCQLTETVTNQTFNRNENKTAAQEWTFKNVIVTALTVKARGTSGTKSAHSNSNDGFWQATLKFEELTKVNNK